MRVELTKGGWAEFRSDFDEITNGERQKVVMAYDDVKDESEIRQGTVLADEMIALLVTAWSYSGALPREDIGALKAIRAKDYDLLAKAAVEEQKNLFVDTDIDPEEGSPTEPSGTSTTP